jgi:hypothetical protein
MAKISEQSKSGQTVVARVLESLGRVPQRGGGAERRSLIPNNEPRWPPADWTRRPHPAYHAIGDPVLLPNTSRLNFVPKDLAPQTDEFLFETDLGVPALIAVSWPKAIDPKTVKQIPYLLYFRPAPNTNGDRWGPGYAGATNLGEYPYGFDFLYFELWGYFNYRADPLTYREERWRPSRKFVQDAGAPFLTETNEKFSFGLPYQIAASGKPVVLVFPILSTAGGLGQFLKADVVEQTMLAIQEYVLTKAGLSKSDATKPLGNTAIAGYSFSVDFVRRMLAERGNATHNFVTNTLKEVYLFDGSRDGNAIDNTIDAALAWSQRNGGGATKSIRIYSQGWSEKYQTVVGKRVTDEPFVITGANPRRTVGFLPLRVWQDAQTAARQAYRVNGFREHRDDFAHGATAEDQSKAFGEFREFSQRDSEQSDYDKFNKVASSDDVHFMIPATMLTDALRRSTLA